MKLKLSPVTQVKTNVLKPNRKNSSYFRSESGSSEKALMEDIRKRGILVPLVIKKDGTILSGHRRRLIAKHLNLKTVPAQYVLQRLSDVQETEYIIKDNLLRRHLEPAEREALYRRIYRDFDDRLLVRNNRELGVNASEIAESTGLNPKTVGYDLARLRRNREKEIIAGSGIESANDKHLLTYKRAIARMLNVAIIENRATVKELQKISVDVVNRLDSIVKNRGME
ncbi:MAG: ParB N-terminal domain-containing protein [Spirochaetes bacterium]|nr:ParB N-terminal domain-containing protein [Spirochaetota bacterium]